jgi:hypothetical protein
MKLKTRSLALALGVMLVGCATQPNGPQSTTGPATVQMDEFGSPMTRQYVIQAAESAPVEILGVTASSSSTRDSRWLDVNNVMDGNTHSAWGPARSDTNPALTLDLGGTFDLASLAIKMSDAPVVFDVAIWDDGEWKTIATGVRPAYAALDAVELPDHRTSKVKLTFQNTDAAQLLVCEVKAFTDKAPAPIPSASMVPTPTPSASVTPTPSPTPTATASPTPTATPTPARECTRLSGEATMGQVSEDPFQPEMTFNFMNVIETSTGVTGQVRFSFTTGSDTYVMVVESIRWENDLIIVAGPVTVDGQTDEAGDGAITLQPLSLEEDGDLTAGPISYELHNSVTGEVITSAPDNEAPLDAGVIGNISECE